MPQVRIIDTGGQYCHLISRRVREIGVESEIVSPDDLNAATVPAKSIIISGGPKSVYADDAVRCPKSIWTSSVPVLGICYGHQLMAHALGGEVHPGRHREYGEAQLEVLRSDTILGGIRNGNTVWMSHGDEVVAPPPGFDVVARTSSCSVAAMSDRSRRKFGLQFHPEVSHTTHGQEVFKNFLFDICGCSTDWNLHDRVSRIMGDIRKQVNHQKLLFFVSGGVDSAVAFALCSEALGPERVLGIFVDTGLMRKDERRRIERTFEARGWHNIKVVDARKQFVSSLSGVCDPEQKRRIVGEAFLTVQRQVSKSLDLSSGEWLFGQGTIYPDTIESGKGRSAALIKTHHNRVQGIEDMISQGLVVEPLNSFYKDEVRAIGRDLSLPDEIVNQHPFPGPGLAVRCICATERRNVTLCPKAATSYRLVRSIDAWTVPLRTVGVQGDFRTYSNLVILTGSADIHEFGTIATRITSELPGTNRVAFLVSSRRGSDLKGAWVSEASITESRLDLLREADAICQETLRQHGLYDQIWQLPVILLPLTFGRGETVALRPVCSSDAMTARFADLPMEIVQEIGDTLLKLHGVDAVIYDVTNKPPATIEWE